MENIEKILKVFNDKTSGYHIKTNKQVIKLLMGDIQHNFEKFGYFLSEDESNFDKFVGAEIIEIKTVDKVLKEDVLLASETNMLKDFDKYEFAFIDVRTSEGTLQFATYNCGSYGHQVRVESEQLNFEKWI